MPNDTGQLDMRWLASFYKSSTWTPIIQGQTTPGVGTYTAQSGYYIRIGNAIFCSCMVLWTAHTGTGQMIVAGLPGNSGNVSNQRFGVMLRTASVTFAGGVPQAWIAPNTAYFSMEYPVSNAAPTAINIEAAGEIDASFFYFVD